MALNVVHVLPVCRGGMRRHAQTLAAALEARGHRCLLLFLDRDGGLPPGVLGRLRRRLRAPAPALVHCHGARAAAAVRLALAWPGMPRLPLVYTVHGPSAPARPRLRTALTLAERWWRGRVDAFIAVSRHLADRLRCEWLVPEERLHVIPPGVDTAWWADLPAGAEARARLGLDPEAPVVAMLGRLAPEKGPDLLVAAAAWVRRWHPRCRFLLAGEGPLRPALERQARAAGLERAVTVPGEVADPRLVLAAADVFVQPSRQEGAGLALREAMAAGRAVVAAAVGGIPEAVSHRRTGLLVSPEDPLGLARAIALLLEDEDLRRRLGAAARREARARFSLEVMVRRTEAVYATVVRKRGWGGVTAAPVG